VTGVSSPKWSDDELLSELGCALQESPVAESIIRAGHAAYTWRTVDAELELLALVAESELADSALVCRGETTVPCTLAFQGAQLSVEIEIDDAGIVGQLTPPRPGQVTLVRPSGPQATTRTDDVGGFAFPPPAPGPLRLACTMGDDRFVTEWVTV
jgi:hypothetical protein